ncbi:hypothetical protein FB451DRAFT_385560 [Mycena latifolia]|nr:hypothetical protein FB451DRAFT_385560 [Mycena latifolia]
MLTREVEITNAVVSAIREPTYKVILSWVLPRTWDSLLSPVDEIREGFRVKGWGSAKYAFLLAFLEVCGGFENGCPLGLYGTVENCLFSEQVFFEILKKPQHPDGSRIVSLDDTVSGSVFIFLGGLWDEVTGLDKVVPMVKRLFIPLIRVAMTAFHDFCPSKKAKLSKTGGPNRADDLFILQRMRDLQFVNKPPRPTQLENLRKHNARILKSPLSTPSSSPTAPIEDVHDEEEVSSEKSLGPVVDQSTNAALMSTAGAVFASMDPFWDVSSLQAVGAGAAGLSAGVGVDLALAVGARAGVGMVAGVAVGVGVGVSDVVGSGAGADAPVLLEAFTLKVGKNPFHAPSFNALLTQRKRPHSDENLPADDHPLPSATNEPTVTMQPRSPLTLRNIGNSSPISLFGPNSPPGWNLAPSTTPNGASFPKQQDEDLPSPDPPLALSLNQVLNIS